jgi:replicative DNA helicase
MPEPNFDSTSNNPDKKKDKKPKTGLENLAHLGKTPPRALDMEQAVLGALVLEKNALHRVIDVLKPEMFWDVRHQLIYEAIMALFGDSKPVDILTVKDYLRKDGSLEKAGGAYYLAEVTSRVASAANIEYHSRVIAEKFILRRLISISDEVIRDSYDETTDVFDLLDKTEQSLFEVSETHLRRNYMGMPELVMQTLKRLEDMKGKDMSGVTGVPSGFMELDKLTSGWQKTDLVIIAARPAMGKCLAKGTKVLMFDGSLQKVEDIKVGDLLMGEDSTPRKVLSLGNGTEKMYWIRQKNGIDYRVNESHILALKDKKNKVHFVEIKDYLADNEQYKSFKGYKVSVEFAEKNTLVEPYFIGLWLMMGNHVMYDCAIIADENASLELHDYLTQFAENQQLTLKHSAYSNANRYQFFNQEGRVPSPLKTTLEAIGVVPEPLQPIIQKFIPDAYLYNSRANRLALLAGLIDAAGEYIISSNVYKFTFDFFWFGKKTDEARFEAQTKWIGQIKFLADSLGFRTQLTNKSTEAGKWSLAKEKSILTIEGNLEEIPVKISHKKANPYTKKSDWRLTEISVVEDVEDEYFGFEIDGDKLFLLEDMTVTHNTAFTLTVARNAAVMRNTPVAFFSLEMAAVQLTQRLVCAEAEIDMQKIRTGRLEQYEWTQLVNKIGNLSNAPIFIDDTPALSIMDLRAKCRRLKAEKKIELVIIDYLQLMTGSNAKGGNREQEIAGISRSLKELAKELEVTVIALAQLSRAVETRGGDKKPMLSDLRESGCITGDSLITDAETGRLVTIKSLAERQAQDTMLCLGVDEDLNVAPRKLVKAFYSGKKQVFELETVTGKKIKASANHPFLTIEGWKRLDNLQIGEKIATPRKITVENPSNPISKMELTLLAHLIGDGCILPKSPYHYTSADWNNIEIVNICAKELFGIEPNIVPQKNWWHTYLKTPYPLTHKVKHPITLWYEKLGLERVRSYDKKLPDSIFECDYEHISLFLKHLWATDGNISWLRNKKENSNRKDMVAIYYGTTSEKLAQQVQYLLLRFGIIAKIRITQKGNYRKSYNVWIEGSQKQLIFLENIGCYGKRGDEIPAMIEHLKTVEPNPNHDIIPKEAWDLLIKPLKEELGISWRDFSAKMGIAYNGTRLFKHGISRPRMSKIAEVLQSPQLKSWAESDVFWEDIRSITPLEIEDVYDVTVEGVHNFTSNAILLHNSIEQDADMVMALYRPEYYGFETDEDGNSTKGMAEVIILKQRNGPTGTAKLGFAGSFGKFVDANFVMGGGGTIMSSANVGDGSGTIEPQKDYFANTNTSNVITIPSKMNSDLGDDDVVVPF